MKNLKFSYCFISLIIFFISCGEVFSSNYKFKASVIAYGGGVSSNNQFVLKGTLGQPIIGLSQNSNCKGKFGFWNIYNALLQTDIPTVYTNSVSDITGEKAKSGGDVTDDGGAMVTARGVCWNTTGSPTTADDYTTNGNGMGSFNSNLTGLSLNTHYYVRAYATNYEGTAYGDEVEFTTLSYYAPPTNQSSNITTWNVRNTSMSIGWSNGNGNGTMVVVKTGNDFNVNDIPQSGEYYYTYNTDFSSAPEVVSGSNGSRIIYYGTGSNISMTGLTALTRYRIRLFAYNGNPAIATAGFNKSTSTNNPFVQRTARYKDIFNQDGVFPESEISILVYPTPANDYINIFIHNLDECRPEIRMFDVNGKEFQIKPEIIQSDRESTLMKLRLDGFVSGIYNLVIHFSEEIIIERLMISR